MIKTELDGLSKAQKLVNMVRLIKKQSESESEPLALLCDAPGIMTQYLEDINWVGFHLMRNGELVLAPF